MQVTDPTAAHVNGRTDGDTSDAARAGGSRLAPAPATGNDAPHSLPSGHESVKTEPESPVRPSATPSGIVTTDTGERLIPSTPRKDGSVRKELRVRPGFTPAEDVARYNAAERVQLRQQRLARERLERLAADSDALVDEASRTLEGLDLGNDKTGKAPAARELSCSSTLSAVPASFRSASPSARDLASKYSSGSSASPTPARRADSQTQVPPTRQPNRSDNLADPVSLNDKDKASDDSITHATGSVSEPIEVPGAESSTTPAPENSAEGQKSKYANSASGQESPYRGNRSDNDGQHGGSNESDRRDRRSNHDPHRSRFDGNTAGGFQSGNDNNRPRGSRYGHGKTDSRRHKDNEFLTKPIDGAKHNYPSFNDFIASRGAAAKNPDDRRVGGSRPAPNTSTGDSKWSARRD